MAYAYGLPNIPYVCFLLQNAYTCFQFFIGLKIIIIFEAILSNRLHIYIYIRNFDLFHTLYDYIKYKNVGHLVLEHTVILRKYNTYYCLIDKNEKN